MPNFGRKRYKSRVAGAGAGTRIGPKPSQTIHAIPFRPAKATTDDEHFVNPVFMRNYVFFALVSQAVSFRARRDGWRTDLGIETRSGVPVWLSFLAFLSWSQWQSSPRLPAKGCCPFCCLCGLLSFMGQPPAFCAPRPFAPFALAVDPFISHFPFIFRTLFCIAAIEQQPCCGRLFLA